MAWPHENSDWQPYISLVEPVFAQIALQISKFEKVLIIAAEPSQVKGQMIASGADMGAISIVSPQTNDTWTRDFGPITVLAGGRPLLLDFAFNGWGLKFPSNHDNQVTRILHLSGSFGTTPLRTPGLVLEGGSIESDGRGTLLTTSRCLLDRNRNPHLGKEEIEAFLASELGARHFLWLDHGYLAGDDTDSHIDTLARLCPDDTILYIKCDDPSDEHYQALSKMEEELRSFRTSSGTPYRLVPLPFPSPCYDEEGNRLPATYANYLVINGAVLVPTYGDKHDGAALEAVRSVFPGRSVIGIDCLPLILQHGSLHCVTMQIPKGVLS